MSRLTRCVRMRRYAIGGISVVAGKCLQPLERPTQAAGVAERLVEQRSQRADLRGRSVQASLRRRNAHLPAATVRQLLVRRGLARPQDPSRARFRHFERSAPKKVSQPNFRSPAAWNALPEPLPATDDYSRDAIAVFGRWLTKSQACPGAPIASSASHAYPQDAIALNFTKRAQAADRKQAFARLVCGGESRPGAGDNSRPQRSGERLPPAESESRAAHDTEFQAGRNGSFRPSAIHDDVSRAAPGRIARGRVVPSRRGRKLERAARAHPPHDAIPPIHSLDAVARRILVVWKLYVAFRLLVVSGSFVVDSPGVEGARLFLNKEIHSSVVRCCAGFGTDPLEANEPAVAGAASAESEVRVCAVFSAGAHRSGACRTRDQHETQCREEGPASIGRKVRAARHVKAANPEKMSPRACDPKSSVQAGMTLPPAPIRLRPDRALFADSTRDSNAKAQTILTTPAMTPLDIRAAAGCRSWDRLLCF
jgi:hypothetical protein